MADQESPITDAVLKAFQKAREENERSMAELIMGGGRRWEIPTGNFSPLPIGGERSQQTSQNPIVGIDAGIGASETVASTGLVTTSKDVPNYWTTTRTYIPADYQMTPAPPVKPAKPSPELKAAEPKSRSIQFEED